MLSNRLAFAALAIACIGAAAGGGYLATRQNVVPSPASAEMQALPPAASGAFATTSAANGRTALTDSGATGVQARPGNRGSRG